MRYDTKAQEVISKKINNSDDEHRKNWLDYKWQLRHSIQDAETFQRLSGVTLKPEELESFNRTVERFPFSATPYYVSLIDKDNYLEDPVFRQSFPLADELDGCQSEMEDPLHEDHDSPVPTITHRYPDRVLFLVSNTCSMYCRHCTRKRRVGEQDYIPNKNAIEEGLEYIRNTPAVRDVLLSGGDPLMMSDERLDVILEELSKIEHVEVIRIGTRMPVVLPYRITDSLIKVLNKHKPIWINTHFNHPREITKSAETALAKLADAGVPLGNQTVLLAGVNDCPRIMRTLVNKLVKNRVRPYYLYQCDLSEGLSHFRTPIGKGIEIIESLIGHTSGFSVPRYVVDAPGGGGKIPVMPNYIISWSTNKVVLRNYEGVITTYKEPDSYEAKFCDRNCDDCHLTLNLESAKEDEYTALGIEKLLSDAEHEISLTPEDNLRMERRDDGG